MVKSEIKFFVRVLPTTKRDWDCIKIEKNLKTIHIKSQQVYTYERPELFWEFNTDKIFTDEGQEKIFDSVFKDAIPKILKGVSMSVIAYGQSNSGKTYTTVGLEGKYEYRGLAPRLLDLLIGESARLKESMLYTVYLSYVEFSRNQCYDLLHPVPKIVDSQKVKPLPLESFEHGLSLLCDGTRRRKFEKFQNNCGTGVITLYLHGHPLAGGRDCAHIHSKIHIVDSPGTEMQWSLVKSDACQADANLIKFSIDKAKTWEKMSNRSLWPPSRNQAVYKSSSVVSYLGYSFTHGILVLLAHIRPCHEDLKITLSTLKFGGRLSSKPVSGMITTTNIDYKKVAKLLEEEVRQLRDEMNIKELLRGEYTELNMFQNEVEHMERLVKKYIAGNVTESCLLSTAKPTIVIQALKTIYNNDMREMKEEFATKLRKASENMIKEKSSPKKKAVHGSNESSARKTSTSKSAPDKTPVKEEKRVSRADIQRQGSLKNSQKKSRAGSSEKSTNKSVKTKLSLSKSGQQSNKKEVSPYLSINLDGAEYEDSQTRRKELWNEWAARNSEIVSKMETFKAELDEIIREREIIDGQLSDLRKKLHDTELELEEQKWKKSVAASEDSANEVNFTIRHLKNEIKDIKLEIRNRVAILADNYKTYSKNYPNYDNIKTNADKSFEEYAKRTYEKNEYIFPPLEEMQDVIPNPEISSIIEPPAVKSQSEQNFERIRAERYYKVPKK